MTFVALGLIAALGVGLVYFGLLRAEEPAEESAEDTETDEEASPRLSLLERLRQPLAGTARPPAGERQSKLQLSLGRAGINLRAREFFLIQLVTAAVLALLAFLRFGNIVPALAALVVGYFIPVVWLRYQQRKRRHLFEASLGDTVVLLSNAMKAGLSVQQALLSVTENGRPPLSEEIGRVTREVSLGIELDSALQHANTRLDSKDFDLVVTAMRIHRQVGGNLPEVLDKIAETIRERVRVHGEVRVMTAQARASGLIITALPFGLVAILSFISPNFESPLLTNPIGWTLIAVSLISIAIGYGIIRRITDIHL
jgi:tight adherence protein B